VNQSRQLRRRPGAWRRTPVLLAAAALVAAVVAPGGAGASTGPWHITVTMAFKHHHTTHEIDLGCQDAKEENQASFKATLTMTVGHAQGGFAVVGYGHETYTYNATEYDVCAGGDPWQKVVATSTTKHSKMAVDWYNSDEGHHRGTHRILQTDEDDRPSADPKLIDVYTESTGHHERDKSAFDEAAFTVDLGKVASVHRGMKKTFDIAVKANDVSATGNDTGYHPASATVTIAK
jgi:hypothetical protein